MVFEEVLLRIEALFGSLAGEVDLVEEDRMLLARRVKEISNQCTTIVVKLYINEIKAWPIDEEWPWDEEE